MNKATYVKADDWCGLFINDKLVEEGHSLEDGEEPLKYWRQAAKRYNFDFNQIEIDWVTDEYYETYLAERGCFPKFLSQVSLMGMCDAN